MRLVAVIALAAACADANPAPAPRETPSLDPGGRAMLAPLREKGLAPDAVVARLALAPDAVVADVGAGPGFFTLPLARAVPEGKVIATDVRGDYLEVLAARAAAADVGRIETRVVARDDPGLAPASVDVAFLCQVDQYLPDRRAYFVALARALRPGGRIVIVNYLRFRDAALDAARAAGLAPADEWQVAPGFFGLVLTGGAHAK